MNKIYAVLWGILVLILLVGCAGGAATRTVDPTPGAGDFTTIQAAINAAAPGDTILVNSGTYHQKVVVNKRLTLRGNDTGSGLPVVDADSSGSAITLSANGCTLKGFVARNARVGASAGIKVTSSNNTITNNIVTASFLTLSVCGIFLDSSSNNIISGNTVTKNFEGIFLDSSSNNIISGNTVTGPLGIRLDSSSNNNISGNTVTNNYEGIHIDSSSNNVISGNTVTNNYRGIRLDSSSNNIISVNTVTGNTYVGIVIGYSGNNNVYLNTFDNANNSLSYSNNNWNANNIQTYEHNGRILTGLLGNIWSDYDGVDCDGDGIGDTPYNIEPPSSGEMDYHPIGGAAPGIEVEKVADRTEAGIGDVINYTIWVNNPTPCTFTGVWAEDNLTNAVWDVGDLAPGESYTNTTSYRVNLIDLPGPITNRLWANGTVETCGTEVNDSAIETVEIIYNPEIEVTKSADPTFGSKGALITFNLDVKNNGTAPLPHVFVSDTLPDGLAYNSSSPGGSNSGQHVNWTDIGFLAPGESKNIWIKAEIDGSVYDTLTNRVNVTGKPEHGDNVTANATANVKAVESEVLVTKSADPTFGSKGALITFNLDVKNNGTASLPHVFVSDTLPDGLAYNSSSPGGANSGQHVNWTDIGPLNSGESKNIWIKAEIDGSVYDTLTNRVNVTGKPEHGDNVTANATANVKAVESEVLVTKSADPTFGSKGALITFNLDVKNNGTASLPHVFVSDTLPDGLAYNSSSPGGANSGQHVNWTDIGFLAPGESRNFWIKAEIDGSVYDTLTNQVNVTGKPEHGDNVTANATANVRAVESEVLVTKSADPTFGSKGALITFNLTVTNNGTAHLPHVFVSDTLPDGLAYNSSSPGGANSGQHVNWTDIGFLAPGESKNLWIEAEIDGFVYGTLTNRVNVTGKPEHGDNVTANATANVQAVESEVLVTKSADPTFGSIGALITFNLDVKNNGTAPLPHVFVSDTLPEGLAYNSSSPGGSNSGQHVNWTDIGPLASGESKNIWIKAEIDGSVYGTLTNRVNVTGKPEHGDNVTANASATVTAKEANISMEMTANPELAALSSEVTFTIKVTNTGEAVLDPVVLIDELPAGMTFVSADSAPDGLGSLRWDNIGPGSLGPGNSTTIKLVATVDGDAKAPLVNHASATGCPECGCNVSCCCSAGVNLPGLGVNKTADKAEYQRGEEIVYTIEITNLADAPVYDVVIRDVFNRGVEFVSADPAPDADGLWRFEAIPAEGTVTITLVVRVPKQDLEFDMGSGVSGEGFVNVADDYSTTLQPYSITNRVSVTSMSTAGEFTDSETVSVLADPGTDLETREHGSGSYDSGEIVSVRSENKSISMEKDVTATYAPTTLGLYNNRTVAYSSKWTEVANAKNRVTGASLSEQYRYATSIDRDSRIFLDENESAMEIEAEFDGLGHVGFLKMPSNASTHQTTPLFEASEDYAGSFKVLEKADEYGSSVSTEKSNSGTGQVVVDKRVGNSQRSYESGTGAYDSEEIVETATNYIAKDISLFHAPTSQSLTGDVAINSSLKWKEGMYSKSPGASLIGEEYTSITELDKDTVARGLNEMDTLANFSGRARYRAVLRDEVDVDEQYEGDYSIERRILFTGVAKYDRPHLNVTKTLDGIVEETLPWGRGEEHLEGEMKTRDVATYTITIENDGNRALGPIYVQDIFPPGSAYIEASLRPSELTDTYTNWTLMNIGIGDVVNIDLELDVSEYSPSELVNRVEVCGGINNGEDWVCASNFSALEVDWLTCCPNETVSVTKTAKIDPVNDSVVRYRVEIKNDDDVTRVATVTDYLPEGMEMLESSIPFASYDGDVVVWNLVEIPASGTAAIEFSALAPGEGRFTNTVEVDARSVDGSVVQPVSANCVIDVGDVGDECGAVSCDSWQPPNWEFEHVGYGPDQMTCEDPTCKSCDETGSCLAP